MRIRSGRTIAVLAMVGAAASAAALAVLQADRIREEWYLWCLGSREAGTSEAAARRLAELGVVRAIPRLVEIVRGREGQEGDPVFCRPGDLTGRPAHAVQALRSLEGPGAVPFLAPLSRDHDPDVRSWALGALSRSRPGGIAAIGEALLDPDAEVRFDAAHTLAVIGMDAEPAAAHLVLALRDESARVRQKAMMTLRRIGANATLAPLMELFEAEPASRPVLAAALLDFYPSSDTPGDAVHEALEDRWPRLVDAAVDEARRIDIERRPQEIGRRLLEAREP
jgi:HEAT repeat protein